MKIEKLTRDTFSPCPRYRTLNARRLSRFETLPSLYYTGRFNLHYYIMIIGGYIADYSKGAKRVDTAICASPPGYRPLMRE